MATFNDLPVEATPVLTDNVFTARGTSAGAERKSSLTAIRALIISGLTNVDVGLANVDDTADSAKPVSTAQQSALDLKANLASPPLTGTPTAPTASPGTNTAQIATTAFSTLADAALLQSFNNRMFYYASAL